MLKDNALTTIQAVKNFIYGNTNDEVNELLDSNIADAINAASSTIENYCRRKFGKQMHIQHVRERMNEVFLDEYPITNLVSVGGVLKDDLSGALYMESEYGILDFTTGSGVRGVVEYEAGYVLPKDATEVEPSTLPSDLELACKHIAEGVYVDEDGHYLESGSIKLGDWTVRDGNASQADIISLLPTQVKVLLDNHRAWPVIT